VFLKYYLYCPFKNPLHFKCYSLRGKSPCLGVLENKRFGMFMFPFCPCICLYKCRPFSAKGVLMMGTKKVGALPNRLKRVSFNKRTFCLYISSCFVVRQGISTKNSKYHIEYLGRRDCCQVETYITAEVE
jgi:hypothetical protein